MRKCLLAAIFMGCVFQGKAQVDPYTLVLSINSIQYKYTAPTYGNGPFNSAKALANASFFLPHNWSLYAGVGYHIQSRISDSSFSDLITRETDYKVYAITNGLPVNLGVRKWLPIKATKNRLAFIIDLDVNGEYSNTSYSATYAVLSPAYHDAIFSINPQLSPGVAYFFTPNWSAECMVGGFNYLAQEDKTIYGDGVPNAITNSQKYFTDFKLSNWRLGVTYIFNKGMKH